MKTGIRPIHIRLGDRIRYGLTSLLVLCFVIYAWILSDGATARPATIWMRVFSYQDYGSWAEIWAYLRELRTGVPPVLSYLELWSFNSRGSVNLIASGLYRVSLIGMLVLPLFLTRLRWVDIGLWFGSAWILLHSILVVHFGNPQLYDVFLPFSILSFLVVLRAAWQVKLPQWAGLVLVFIAGFWGAMAELARPFMLALLPVLVAYAGYQLYQKGLFKRFWILLIPILLLSGGWHAKLLIFNNGQLIWSNHGGTNLFRAWLPLIDQDKLNPQLKAEAPPIRDNNWAWDNINTQVHAENSALRSRAVRAGIASQPARAWSLFWEKVDHFTAPQTDMYAYSPRVPILPWYRKYVRIAFWLLAFVLLVRGLSGFWDPGKWVQPRFMHLAIAFFLSFLPIIGEAGEEARFIVAVVPFLMLSLHEVWYLLQDAGRWLRKLMFPPPSVPVGPIAS